MPASTRGFGSMSAACSCSPSSPAALRRHELPDVAVVLRRRGAGTDHHRWRHRLRGR